MKKSNRFILLLSIYISLLFTACSDIGSSGSATIDSGGVTTSITIANDYTDGIVGLFVDPPVSGLDYSCDGDMSKTDSQGLFNCQTTPVSFYVGNLMLGTVSNLNSDYIVYPQDLLSQPRSAAFHPEVAKIALLLQSLDSDANPSNGIDIKQTAVETLNTEIPADSNIKNINLVDLTSTLETIIANDSTKQLRLVTTQQAKDHLALSLSAHFESPAQP